MRKLLGSVALAALVTAGVPALAQTSATGTGMSDSPSTAPSSSMSGGRGTTPDTGMSSGTAGASSMDQSGMPSKGKMKRKGAHADQATSGSSSGRRGARGGGGDNESATVRQLNEQELNRARSGG